MRSQEDSWSGRISVTCESIAGFVEEEEIDFPMIDDAKSETKDENGLLGSAIQRGVEDLERCNFARDLKRVDELDEELKA